MIIDEEKAQNNWSEMFIGAKLERFLETGNPLLAWDIFFTARRFGVPVPAEVFAYLDAVAFQMMKLSRKPPAPKARAAAMAKALGMGKDSAGAGSPFADYSTLSRDREVAIDAFFQIKEGGKDYLVFEDVAEAHNLSGSTVRRIYLEHRAKWERQAEKLRDQGFTGGQDQQLFVFGDEDTLREMSIIMSLAKKVQK